MGIHELMIAVFISGKGSNFKAINTACREGKIKGRICCVISNTKRAKGLDIARRTGIPVFVFSKKYYPENKYSYICKLLKSLNISLIALAGYLELLEKPLIEEFNYRILNIHPAPLPEFGGKGMYGLNVHKAVLKTNIKFTGPTIHLVDGVYDHGKIISHIPVEIKKEDRPETLAARVLEKEHLLYVDVISKISRGEIELSTL